MGTTKLLKSSVLVLLTLVSVMGSSAQATADCGVCKRMRSLAQARGAEELKKHLSEAVREINEFEFKPGEDPAVVREQADSVSEISAVYIPVEQKTEGTVDLMEFYYQLYNQQPIEMEKARLRLESSKQQILKSAYKQMTTYYKCGTGGCN